MVIFNNADVCNDVFSNVLSRKGIVMCEKNCKDCEKKIDFVEIARAEKRRAERRARSSATLTNLHTMLANNLMEQDFLLNLIDEINAEMEADDAN